MSTRREYVSVKHPFLGIEVVTSEEGGDISPEHDDIDAGQEVLVISYDEQVIFGDGDLRDFAVRVLAAVEPLITPSLTALKDSLAHYDEVRRTRAITSLEAITALTEVRTAADQLHRRMTGSSA